RVAIEAGPIAGVARHFDVGQEVHLDGAHALAFADRAAAIAGIERKARRAPAAHAGFAGVGELAAHVVPESDVRGRARTRRLADGRLVHFQHPVDGFPAGDLFAAMPARRLALRYGLQQVVEQYFARQGGLARTR